jgi:hypothetical protein
MGKIYPPVPEGYQLLFRPWRTDPKTGEKVWAKWFGKRAFPILVPIN